jgi:signal transduction histidine kinase
VSDGKETAATDLQQFAGAVAHEIRTPLTAVAGEIEVALRRDRSAAEYREVLRRLAGCVAELVAISGDLALLNEPVDPRYAAKAARLDVVLTQIRDRYHGNGNIRVAVSDAPSMCVAGDERRLGRAIALLVEHAMRHRRGNACVTVGAVAVRDSVRIVISAEPSGFWPHAWSSVRVNAADASGPLRLRTARRILDESRGTLHIASGSGTDIVHIELQPFA